MRWRRWALRSVLAFGVVLVLGAAGVPTLIPYIAAILAVIVDAARVARDAK